MSHVYDEIIDFIASGPSSESVASYEASAEVKDRVAELIRKEKTENLTPEEATELDDYMTLEHLMRMAKARARSLCNA
jgi:hypothetical protein